MFRTYGTTLVIGLLATGPVAARAQGQPTEPVCVVDGLAQPPGACGMQTRPKPPSDDPLAQFLFPPELIIANQEAIGLTDKQRSAIQDAMKDAQSRLIDVQFKMSGEVAKLQKLLQAPAPDEAKTLDQVDRVLSLERDMKRAQMGLMVRIKSQLTEKQQAMLNQLRPNWANGAGLPKRPPEG